MDSSPTETDSCRYNPSIPAENSSRQRCAEETRKHGAHTAHGQHRPILVSKFYKFSQHGCHTSAQLQCSALPTGGTAEQMGDGTCQEDHRGHHGADGLAVQNGIDDLVGATVIPQTKEPINTHTQQAAHRQQENQPGMLPPQVRYEMQRMMEARAQQTADDTHQQSKQHPFQKGLDVIFRMMEFIEPCHMYPLFFLLFFLFIILFHR